MEIEKLIEACLNKNPKAEKELYFLYAKRVFGICRRYTNDRQRAEDYMQESFEKIFSKLDRYDPVKGAFSTWVSSIVSYTIISAQKKRKIKIDYSEVLLQVEDQEQEALRFETRKEICYGITAEDLLTAIRKLPDDYRDIINLFVFENWRHADIAVMLNIEVSSSRSKLTRAKQMLKKILTKTPNSYEGRMV